ncbi:uncharacterized protein TNCV_618401 [Trichonephila clavipes]|nr:uncharacterized protein TNCV_618401 [Trichonephila clavipes]
MTPELAPLSPNYHTNGKTFQLSTDLTCVAALHGSSRPPGGVPHTLRNTAVATSINRSSSDWGISHGLASLLLTFFSKWYWIVDQEWAAGESKYHSAMPIICQVIYSQFGLAIHPNDHQARRRFVEWAQNESAVPDFHKQILFSEEAHFWLNGYVNKQNCRIWSEANPKVYVETPLHPEKLTVWCALWAGGILLQKR